MAGLPTALRLLACRGDDGLLGMREKTSVRVLCGLWFRWPPLGFTGIWRFREAQTPLSAERQTGIRVCQAYESRLLSQVCHPWAFHKVDGFCLLN